MTKPSKLPKTAPNWGPDTGGVPMPSPRLCPGKGQGYPGGVSPWWDVPTAVGVALTHSGDSGDSRFLLEVAGLRRPHRHRDSDETSRMPTSGATSRTELGMSLKSSLGGDSGAGEGSGVTPQPLPAPSPTNQGALTW